MRRRDLKNGLLEANLEKIGSFCTKQKANVGQSIPAVPAASAENTLRKFKRTTSEHWIPYKHPHMR